MILKRFGCTAIHNKALYKYIIHSFIHSESIEGDTIIIEYIFTVVTTNDILLYDMINMFLNMMVSF